MSSYEHRIILGAQRLTDALDANDEETARACVVDLCELVKAMRRERRSDAPHAQREATPGEQTRVEYDPDVNRG